MYWKEEFDKCKYGTFILYVSIVFYSLLSYYLLNLVYKCVHKWK